MQYKQYENLVFIRLDEGEDLIESIKKICRELRTSAAVIISGLGQLQKVKIGYYREKDNYTPMEYKERFELLSMTGTIIKHDNEYKPHLHVVLGREDKKTVGGHLLGGTIGVTGEIILQLSRIEIKRKYNPGTGLQEMTFI
ncbi:MAG: hypothetical protein DRN12_05595 [Thermoplasmata archaeon]|nr:MAG: hypothetical protein DRN12_05595 [Thermoplasmata archaeon]